MSEFNKNTDNESKSEFEKMVEAENIGLYLPATDIKSKKRMERDYWIKNKNRIEQDKQSRCTVENEQNVENVNNEDSYSDKDQDKNEVTRKHQINKQPILSKVTTEDRLVEVFTDRNLLAATLFLTNIRGGIERAGEIEIDGIEYAPKTDENIAKGYVTLPTGYEKEIDPYELLRDIIEYIKKYIDLESDLYYEVVGRYVMFTWVYDRFSKIPYLRVVGPYGNGKSRFLDVLRPICYHSSKMGVAVTTPNLFRWIEDYPGTILFDEVEIENKRDNKDLIDILNCGNDINSPGVHRQQKDANGNYTSKVYQTFCPKILSSRNTFNDDALESRILDIKLAKPKKGKFYKPLPKFEKWEETYKLRNRLLGYRFNYWSKIDCTEQIKGINGFDAREQEMLAPLVFVTTGSTLSRRYLRYARLRSQELATKNNMTRDGQIIQTLIDMSNNDVTLTIQNIRDNLIRNKIVPQYASNQYVGKLLRGIGLEFQRKDIGYVLFSSKEEIIQTGERYGVTE
jgi:hypothetical protein